MRTDDSAHTSVLLDESLEYLAIRNDGIYLDATFGRGGHSGEIIKKLSEKGRLLAIDRDAMAQEVAIQQFGTDSRFCFFRGGFAEMKACVTSAGVSALDGILMDLGVSSPQLDTAERGFSFQSDGPLDMRMDQNQALTAARFINEAPEAELADVFFRYGEERHSRRIARAIVTARDEKPLTRTQELSELVADNMPGRHLLKKHPATRVFQAIRIHINDELGQLSSALETALRLLIPGGRLVVISFHSLEDRIVKQFMRDVSTPLKAPRGLPVADDYSQVRARIIARKVRAGEVEKSANPRARSAVLRALEKLKQ